MGLGRRGVAFAVALGLVASSVGCGRSAPWDLAGSDGCPPQGPFGTEPGDLAPNLTLRDCAGQPVELHQLCRHRAAYLYTFAAWCQTCQAAAASGEDEALFEQFRDQDFAMWFVVTGTTSSAPPDAAYCQAVQVQYGLPMTVLYDAEGVTESVLDMLPNGDDLVLSRGAVVELNGSARLSTVERTLAELFGR